MEEQQQSAEVQQFLQGQRELIERLEAELKVLEAHSCEQEQAMLELKENKALEVEELQAQQEELRKEFQYEAPRGLGVGEGEHVMARSTPWQKWMQ